jgi:glycosyltransferase involved in cell wall biosynthesis
MKRKWHINGRFVSQPVTGVQRYAHEIARALDRLVAENPMLARSLDLELTVPADGPRNLPELKAIPVRAIGGSAGHKWEQVALGRHAGSGLLSLCNTGPLLPRKHIVCIHDVNTRVYPESYSFAFRALYRGLHPALGWRAARIATVSRHSAEQIARYRIAPADKVIVIPNGHEHALRWRPEHSPATRAAAGPDTIVIIGSPAPHKNVRLIIGLAPKLAAEGLRVAVAGLSDGRVFAAHEPRPEADNVVWLGRLSDNELAALLQGSLCLAFPSLAEGFGLPALEAMALGCPVVVSDRTSLPEVCADAALYASPYDAEAWLARFLELRKDARLRGEMIARGRRRAAEYSWTQSARLYLQAMADLD